MHKNTGLAVDIAMQDIALPLLSELQVSTAQTWQWPSMATDSLHSQTIARPLHPFKQSLDVTSSHSGVRPLPHAQHSLIPRGSQVLH